MGTPPGRRNIARERGIQSEPMGSGLFSCGSYPATCGPQGNGSGGAALENNGGLFQNNHIYPVPNYYRSYQGALISFIPVPLNKREKRKEKRRRNRKERRPSASFREPYSVAPPPPALAPGCTSISPSSLATGPLGPRPWEGLMPYAPCLVPVGRVTSTPWPSVGPSSSPGTHWPGRDVAPSSSCTWPPRVRTCDPA